jgi:hypothetical protein
LVQKPIYEKNAPKYGKIPFLNCSLKSFANPKLSEAEQVQFTKLTTYNDHTVLERVAQLSGYI